MAEPRNNTRDRILESCRTLFNERGPAEVTTAEIATVVGISEGNLHYHFRRKEQIVVALFEQFEDALDRAGTAASDLGQRPQAYRIYLAGWFNTMWEWRLFYAAGIYRLAPALGPRLTRLTDKGQSQVRQTLDGLAEKGVLVAAPHEIERLVVNAWIVASYWIDYLRSRQGVETITRDHLRWGYAQVEALFTPYAAASLTATQRGAAPPTQARLQRIGTAT